MPRETKIKYDPSLSVAENAKKCGVSVAAIRYYIKTRGIDRRYEGKVKVLEGMKAYLAEHPNATRAELQKATGHGINTIRRYWDVLHGTDELPTNQNKSNLREREKVVSHKRHITYLDKLPIEFIREYLEAREAAANAVIEDVPEVVEQTPKTAKTPKKTTDRTSKKGKAKTTKDNKHNGTNAIKCTDEYVYFYSDKSPFSNWNITPHIKYKGLEFSNSEALFMYLKAVVFRDDEMAKLIIPLNPRGAKACARLVRNYSESIWEKERENAMYIALKAKFDASQDFRDALLADEYRGKTFVEASPSDDIWGIKRSVEDAYNGASWRGLNLLGKLLTELRDEKLGLREPIERTITPISEEAVLDTYKVDAVPKKSSYSIENVLLGSVLGGIIGDIAGSTREGYGNNQPSPRVLLSADSYFTDDSTLIVAVADWLNNKDKTTLKECLIKWSNRYPNVGFGGLYKTFIETGEAQESNGNGGAMRVAPCAVVAKTLEEAMQMAEAQCKITHTTDVAIDGAKAIAAAIFIAKDFAGKGKSDIEIKAEVKSYIETHFCYNLNKTLSEIQAESMELYRQKTIFKACDIPSPTYMNMSNAALSCPMAITAFLLGNSFEETIRYSLAMLGDSDSIAAMAGCISAQVYGIPQALVNDALTYLPLEIVEVLNRFEGNNLVPSRTTPPNATKWTTDSEVVVYGSGEKNNEKGGDEAKKSRYNPLPLIGYPIPTIGKTLAEIKDNVNTFIEYAKQHPELRFHIRKVGYDKAGYTLEQIAPLFKVAKDVANILLPKEMFAILNG